MKIILEPWNRREKDNDNDSDNAQDEDDEVGMGINLRWPARKYFPAHLGYW